MTEKGRLESAKENQGVNVEVIWQKVFAKVCKKICKCYNIGITEVLHPYKLWGKLVLVDQRQLYSSLRMYGVGMQLVNSDKQ